MKKILTFLLEFIIVVIVILIIAYFRNLYILNNLSINAKKYYSIDNYHLKSISYENSLISITNIYCSNNKYIKDTNYHLYSNDSFSKKIYHDSETNITLLEKNGSTVVKLGIDDENISILNIFKDKNIFSMALQNMSSEKCNTKNCYIINIDDTKFFIEKTTGLIVRIINSNNQETDTVVDYYYEFNSVNDNIIQKPEISNYKIID